MFDLSYLKRLHADTTPGQWEAECDDDMLYLVIRDEKGLHPKVLAIFHKDGLALEGTSEDLVSIVKTHETFPALIEWIEKAAPSLREQIGRAHV